MAYDGDNDTIANLKMSILCALEYFRVFWFTKNFSIVFRHLYFIYVRWLVNVHRDVHERIDAWCPLFGGGDL